MSQTSNTGPRHIPEFPGNMPELKDHHPGMVEQTYTIKVITPMFGGGVEAGVPDTGMPIRPSSIRGHLRFWWRATRGARYETVKELRQREGEIWGATDNCSPISIVVEAKRVNSTACAGYKWNPKKSQGRGGQELVWKPPFDQHAQTLPYVLFPFQGKPPRSQHENPEKVPAEQVGSIEFKLNVNIPTTNKMTGLAQEHNEQRKKLDLSALNEQDADIKNDVEAAIWAWVNFGGIGARTRRGCGALHCVNAPPSIDDFHAPRSEDVQSWLSNKLSHFDISTSSPVRDWPTFPKIILLKTVNGDAIRAWSEAVSPLKMFRQGEEVGRDAGADHRPGRSRWPEAESIRELVAAQRLLPSAGRAPWHPVDSRRSGTTPMPVNSFPRAEFGMPVIFELREESIQKNKKTGIWEGSKTPPFMKPSLQPGKEVDRMASPLILRPIKLSSGSFAAMIALLPVKPLVDAYLKQGEQDLVKDEVIGTRGIRAATLAKYSNSPMGSPNPGKPERSVAGSALEAFLAYAKNENGFNEVIP